VAAQLQLQGANVVVTDPAAVENARRAWPQLEYADTPEEAAREADAVLLLTEWAQYRGLDPVRFGGVVRGKRMLDGRNALDRDAWEAAGWSYRALGRPMRPPAGAVRGGVGQ
jgi:UDPglucose 6-dehydrogenase